MAARKVATTTAVVEHASLNEALLAVQKAMPAFQRDAVNPHFNSAYLQLETLLPQVLEVLNANGLLLTQLGTYVGPGVPALTTRITHVPTGDAVEDTLPLSAGGETPQKQGSAMTFAKRYSLMAFLGITADKDEDGNIASRPAVAPVAAPVPFVAGVIGQSPDAVSPFSGAL